MAEQNGVEIAGTFYPFHFDFTMGDAVLIHLLTALDIEEFMALFPDPDLDDPDYKPDYRLMHGIIGVAVWRKHPTWSVERVSRFVQSTKLDEMQFPDVPEEEPDPPSASSLESDKPPSGGARKRSSGTPSDDGSVDRQETIPEPTGTPVSRTGVISGQ